MNRSPILIAAAAAIIPSVAVAQAPSGMLFTPSTYEESRSGSAGNWLRHLNPNHIALVKPEPSLRFSAERFVSDWSYQTMAGDHDGDGRITDISIMEGIDAILSLPYEGDGLACIPRARPATVYTTFISPSADLGTSVSGGVGLRKGDCGRIIRNGSGNGQIEHFITAEQIISALGMFDANTGRPLRAADIDLDAITVSLDRHIFLSFDGDHMLRLSRDGVLSTYLLEDGGIAVIPGPLWTPHANGTVATVRPQHGQILFDEAHVGRLVAASNAADVNGLNPSRIGDTEGLAIDLDTGSTFTNYWHNRPGFTNYQFDHLLISGETLTGCGSISTNGAGSIATLNGVPLAASAPTPTWGRRMGLDYASSPHVRGHTQNLEAIAVAPCAFAIATPTPSPSGSLYSLHVGTDIDVDPTFPMAVMMVGVGSPAAAVPVAASGDVASAPSLGSYFSGNRAFPEYQLDLFPPPVGTSPFGIVLSDLVPLTSAGSAHFGSIGGARPVGFPGVLIYQAMVLDRAGSLHLSPPGTIE